MSGDPRTFGGVTPRGEVALVRTPLNIPLEPAQRDDGHVSMGSASEIARNPDRGIADDQPPPPPEPDHSPPTSAALDNQAEQIVQRATRWMKSGVTGKTADDLATIDQRDTARTEKELRSVWGDAYDVRLEKIKDFVRALPDAERNIVLHARDPETGSALLNDPGLMVRLAGFAGRPRPAEMTIAGIEKFMRTNRKDYNKDLSIQELYRRLLGEREREKGAR